MKMMRRLKRGNVHPLYGTKYRKGNKGDKGTHLQLVSDKANEVDYVTKDGKVRTTINRCIVCRTKTILHWKV